jgi:GNAT superfamily N-acetyltransferase
MKIISSAEVGIKETAALALNAHLFEKDGVMASYLTLAFLKPNKKTYSFSRNKTTISYPHYLCFIALIEGQPVSCLLILGYRIQFYTKPAFRRRGIASRLFSCAKQKYPGITWCVNVNEDRKPRDFLTSVGIAQKGLPFRNEKEKREWFKLLPYMKMVEKKEAQAKKKRHGR